MTEDFEDVEITSFDERASGPSGDRALTRLVFRLSRGVPTAWARFFDQEWQHAFYTMKRRAAVSGNSLELIAMPNEVEQEHLPQLKKAIAQANAAYRKFLEEQQRLQRQAAEEETRQRQTLADLKGSLKF